MKAQTRRACPAIPVSVGRHSVNVVPRVRAGATTAFRWAVTVKGRNRAQLFSPPRPPFRLPQHLGRRSAMGEKSCWLFHARHLEWQLGALVTL